MEGALEMGHLSPRSAALLGAPKDMLSETGMAFVSLGGHFGEHGGTFLRGPFWGAWRDIPFLGPLTEGIHFFI
jgi:hypothetical protein